MTANKQIRDFEIFCIPYSSTFYLKTVKIYKLIVKTEKMKKLKKPFFIWYSKEKNIKILILYN